MAAPRGGPGPYSLEEIESVLTTAYVGFRAAVLETRSSRGPESRTIVHTGYWGCGAFGGNRVLMSLLQALAGELSGVHRLVFHCGDDRAALDKALTILRNLRQASTPMIAIELQARKFEWGTSDGN